MSKLSFRARALDANKSLPVYHADDIPDLSDYSSVNRVVPQMPTGMEKEEETEHHLQRAITAQQIYGEAQRLIIPTPEAIFDDSDYQQLKQLKVTIPKQYVHVQAFNLEDELPEYDYDEEDELWIKKFNTNRQTKLTEVEFERLYECLEKACGNQPETLSLSAAHFVLKSANDDVIQGIYEYWQRKRGVSSNTNSGLGTLKSDKKDSGGATHDPYIAFRRRVEKMQTRKNRKNDEASYEKMIKLRRDLQRACLILEMVKSREETKRNILQTTVDVCDKRYKHGDFSGELLMQCFDILRRRQSAVDRRHIEHQVGPSNASLLERREHEEQQRRLEISDDLRKRHGKGHRARLPSTDPMSSMSESRAPSVDYFSEPEEEPAGPDGKFTFKRRKGVIYKAPRYDVAGNWPWVHAMEGGTASRKFRYCYTTLSKAQKPLGLARRRRGRGGRVLFDRAHWSFEDYLSEKDRYDPLSLPNGIVSNSQSNRLPPWPHFKLVSQVLEEREHNANVLPAAKIKLQRSSVTESSKGPGKPSLHRSFSSQPTSKFRVHPYASSSVAQSKSGTITSPSATSSNVPSPVTSNDRRNSATAPTHDGIAGTATTITLESSQLNSISNISLQSKTLASQQRLPSTAPTSAVYQLNFPILISNSSSTTTTLPVQNRRMPVRTENGSVASTTISSHKSTKLAANKLSIVTPKAQPGNGINNARSVVGALDALPGFNTFRSAATELTTTTAGEVK